MKAIMPAICFILAFSSCEKQDECLISGTYEGYFFRSAPGAGRPSSQVRLHLNQNSFTGQSSDARYPAICHGSWTTEENFLNFDNSCQWTSDFDTTFILDGEYEFELKGDHLKLWKVRGVIRDTYDLVKVNSN